MVTPAECGPASQCKEMIHVIVLGMLAMGCAGTLCALLISDNLSAAPTYTPRLLGHSLPSVNAVIVFSAGLTLALLFCLGAWMVAAGVIERHRSARGMAPVDEFLPGQWRTP
jgi:hypothetical protein